MSAQNPAQTGALQLVPPNSPGNCLPFRIKKTPSAGSAVRLTSGTSRFVPEVMPEPTCQTGRLIDLLFPPPLPDQPLSSETVPLAARTRVVPPTPMTFGSDAAYSTWRGPSEFWPVESGFEPASPLETK